MLTMGSTSDPPVTDWSYYSNATDYYSNATDYYSNATDYYSNATDYYSNATDMDNVTTARPLMNISQWWFGQIFPWVIILFGVVGNCCVVFVLSHQKYSRISTCYYMKALAWSDNFVMLLLFIRWLSKVPGSPMKPDTLFCVMYFFFVRFGFGMSAWTLMFMTVDRYISVKWPLKAGELCTIKRARISLVVIAFVHVFGHLPYFWRYYDPNAITLSQQCPYNLPEAFATAYSLLRMLIFDRLLPWILTLGFTVAMSWELYIDVRNSRRQLGENKGKEQLSRRVTAMSLIVSWVFFFLTFPTSVDYGIRVLEFFNGKFLSVSAFLYDLWVYFLYLNSALNFYLYICASEKFREDFRTMFCALFGVELIRKTSRGSLSAASARRAGQGVTPGPTTPASNGRPSLKPSPTEKISENQNSNGNGICYDNPEFTHM